MATLRVALASSAPLRPLLPLRPRQSHQNSGSPVSASPAELAQMIGGRRHDAAGARVAEHALEIHVARERGAAARLHRQVGDVDGRLDRGQPRQQHEQRRLGRTPLDEGDGPVEQRGRLLGADAHVGQPRAQRRQVAQRRPGVLEGAGLQVRGGGPDGGAAQTVRHRRRTDVEPREDHLQHRRGALALRGNQVAVRDADALQRHRRRVVAAQAEAVEGALHAYGRVRTPDQKQRRFERRRRARLLSAGDVRVGVAGRGDP